MKQDKSQQEQFKRYVKRELKSAVTYQMLADLEQDQGRAAAFERLSRAEQRHVESWARRLDIDPASLQPLPSRVRKLTLWVLAHTVGTSRILPQIMKREMADVRAYRTDPEASQIVREENSQSEELRKLAGIRDPAAFIRSRERHASSGGGSLRAAVLGVNDGLASNFNLVMGVAGGTGNPALILLTGISGLLAGAFSMAAGEYVSMRSQREVAERQIEMEQTEVEQWPHEEEAELALIYQAKGLSREEAKQIAHRLMSDPDTALDTLSKEELGLDPNSLGSPWGASISSFTSFSAGAFVPIAPYLFGAGSLAFLLSALLSAVSLFIVGSAVGRMSRRS